MVHALLAFRTVFLMKQTTFADAILHNCYKSFTSPGVIYPKVLASKCPDTNHNCGNVCCTCRVTLYSVEVDGSKAWLCCTCRVTLYSVLVDGSKAWLCCTCRVTLYSVEVDGSRTLRNVGLSNSLHWGYSGVEHIFVDLSHNVRNLVVWPVGNNEMVWAT